MSTLPPGWLDTGTSRVPVAGTKILEVIVTPDGRIGVDVKVNIVPLMSTSNFAAILGALVANAVEQAIKDQDKPADA
jgi:hypothetical protein